MKLVTRHIDKTESECQVTALDSDINVIILENM